MSIALQPTTRPSVPEVPAHIDEHHGYLRFAWELVGPDGTVALTGLDVGELADDGRLRRITGFFGELSVEQNAWSYASAGASPNGVSVESPATSQ